MTPPPSVRPSRKRVLIAGAGVAALETALALRSHVGEVVEIELLSPEREFLYRPILVAEPFEAGRARTFPLADLARTGRFKLVEGALDEVEVPRRRVRVLGSVELPFDFLVLAIGARREPWLEGALTFRDRDDAEALRRTLHGGLIEGEIDRLVFAAPPGEVWTLPLYELAFLTAAFMADRRVGDVELTVVTPESEPLGVFGKRAAEAIRSLLLERGIRVRAGTRVTGYERGRLRLGEATLLADAVVTLPRVTGRYLAGVSHDERGFIPVDEFGRVPGTEGVFAAGDGTTFPIKQGGLAAQQADAVAEAIAAELGAPIDPSPFRPVLRGLALTGLSPTYLRAEIGAHEEDRSQVTFEKLWSPASKIAGRYLAPFLAGRTGDVADRELVDRHPPPRALQASDAERRAARDLVLALADASAGWDDYDDALRALDVVERTEGILTPEYEAKRKRWEKRRPQTS